MKKSLLLLSSLLMLGISPVVSAENTKLTPDEEVHFLLMNEMMNESGFFFSFNPDNKMFSIVLDVPTSEEVLQVRNDSAMDHLVNDVSGFKEVFSEAGDSLRKKLGDNYSLRVINGKNVEDVFFEFTNSEEKDTVFVQSVSTNESNSNQDVSQEYKNALDKAYSYANQMHMSKQGVYDQLVSEYGSNFPEDAAQYAIDNLDVDWNYNALQKAKSYYEKMSMSKQGIYEQLVSEYGSQFTPEEAQYAIDNLE